MDFAMYTYRRINKRFARLFIILMRQEAIPSYLFMNCDSRARALIGAAASKYAEAYFTLRWWWRDAIYLLHIVFSWERNARCWNVVRRGLAFCSEQFHKCYEKPWRTRRYFIFWNRNGRSEAFNAEIAAMAGTSGLRCGLHSRSYCGNLFIRLRTMDSFAGSFESSRNCAIHVLTILSKCFLLYRNIAIPWFNSSFHKIYKSFFMRSSIQSARERSKAAVSLW